MLFRHPALSEVTLLAGILPLTFCTAGLATGAHSWKLPSREHVVGLVTPDFRDDGTPVRVVGTNAVDAVESGAFGGLWVGSREVAGRESDKPKHINLIWGQGNKT